MRFPKTVAAIRSITEARFVLAEALATEIPPRRRGPTPKGQQSIPEQLADAAAEIEAETGEVYAVDTLNQYRAVALWVSGGAARNFEWAEASWTAHIEAYKKGETFEQFAGDPDTKRRVRARNGGATGDVPAAARAISENPVEAKKLIDSLSDEGRAAVLEAGMEREVEHITGKPAQPHRPVGSPLAEWERWLTSAMTLLTQVMGVADKARQDGDAALYEHIRDEVTGRVAHLVMEVSEDISTE